jgi:alpha-mannosidase
VAEGRWEPLGGMWVEADCNITGSESLARQFLLGRSFYRRHFGSAAESPVLWLPDVFGYTWNLPQLIKEAGLEYFFTIKIGWNQYNHLRYDSFWWQGLDGTRVLTHFSPTPEAGSAYAATCTATVNSQQVLSTWTHFKHTDWGQSGQVPLMLMAYGYGDGGGGPTREMVETIRILDAFPAMPRMRYSTVAEFFHQLEAGSGGTHLPIWNGELYLEYHRGTYTSQSRNKRANRKSEFLLHDTEFLAALAAGLEPEYAYPAEDLKAAWQLVCLNQFHDILPGSSINPVYSESLEQYAQLELSQHWAATCCWPTRPLLPAARRFLARRARQPARAKDLGWFTGSSPTGRRWAAAGCRRAAALQSDPVPACTPPGAPGGRQP